jgi:hypothetical protein
MAEPKSCTVIGIAGKAHSGKDTLAQYMYGTACIAGKNVRRIAFADFLKDVVRGMGVKQTEDGDVDKMYENPLWDNKTGRQLLCEVGDALRTVDPKIFIKCVEAKINEWSSYTDFIIITDVRFANEFHFVKSIGGYLVNIRRPIADEHDIGGDKTHASECELDTFPQYAYDRQVCNIKDLRYLQTEAERIICGLLVNSRV